MGHFYIKKLKEKFLALGSSPFCPVPWAGPEYPYSYYPPYSYSYSYPEISDIGGYRDPAIYILNLNKNVIKIIKLKLFKKK